MSELCGDILCLKASELWGDILCLNKSGDILNEVGSDAMVEEGRVATLLVTVGLVTREIGSDVFLVGGCLS